MYNRLFLCQSFSLTVSLFSSEFTQNDVLTDANSVTGAGNGTVVGVVVNNPGGNSPVENDVVEEALHQTLQENPNSTISGLTFGIVNTPTVSDEQSGETISIRLPGTSASEVILFAHVLM